MLATALAQVRKTYTGMLRDLALDWPGSWALVARLGVALAAQHPQAAEECLFKCLRTGLDAYRAARKEHTHEEGPTLAAGSYTKVQGHPRAMPTRASGDDAPEGNTT